MPTPFELVVGVASLVALGLLFVLGRRLVSAWLVYRGTRVVGLPRDSPDGGCRGGRGSRGA